MSRMEEQAELTVRAPGDPPASLGTSFEAFFAQRHAVLFAALRLVTGSHHEAEELSQDAFLRVWERWERVRAMDDPDGYLFRTALNLFRSRRRRTLVALRHIARPREMRDGLAVVEERDMVARALARLAPRQRAALVLTEGLGLTSAEVGHVLGIRASTVRVQLARARAALREANDHEQ